MSRVGSLPLPEPPLHKCLKGREQRQFRGARRTDVREVGGESREQLAGEQIWQPRVAEHGEGAGFASPKGANQASPGQRPGNNAPK
jgi:hypothetical protein